MKNKFFTSFLIVFLLGYFAKDASSVTRLGIHVTQEELGIWKKRAIDGPYKNEWDTIVGRADEFVADPEPRWRGQTTDTCYDSEVNPKLNRKRDRGLRDAGFVYMVTGKKKYRDAVQTALLAQAIEPGTDFSNRARWCVPGSGDIDFAGWIRRLTYGYDYVRSSLSSQDRKMLDTWFRDAGYFWKDVINEIVTNRFPDRLDNNYSTCGGSPTFCPGKDRGLTHYGGPMTKNFHLGWNNQGNSLAACFAAIGVMLNDHTLKSHAKRYVKEWLKYGVFPGGVVFDQMRWNTADDIESGYNYEGTAIGSIITIVDHLARAGDAELYEYSTNDGMYGSEGRAKSLLGVMQHFAGLTNGYILEYGATSSTSDPDLLIAPSGPTQNSVTYVYLAPANIYYNDPDVTEAYTAPLPDSYMTGGYDPLGGDWGSYPSIRFMFGQMEGVVWPYSDESPTAFCDDKSGNCPPSTGSLANSDNMTATSQNFRSDHPPEHLWDGCIDQSPECTTGGIIPSFWIEFDFGRFYDLTEAALFGDAYDSWISETWTLQYKENQSDAWIEAFSDQNAFANDWITQDLTGITARYVRVEVFGNQDYPATQARELEIYGIIH